MSSTLNPIRTSEQQEPEKQEPSSIRTSEQQEPLPPIRTSEQQEPEKQVPLPQLFYTSNIDLNATHWTDEVVKPKYKEAMNARLRAMPKRFLTAVEVEELKTELGL